ncbi:MAG: hypothetical protein Q9M82_03750, partial [Mariprofundus sp.]|nr:hypothetical protein [Mariprofundus sp.]
MNKKIAVGVCHGPRCGDYGGRALAVELRHRKIEVEALDCQSLCPYSPIVRLHEHFLTQASGK